MNDDIIPTEAELAELQAALKTVKARIGDLSEAELGVRLNADLLLSNPEYFKLALSFLEGNDLEYRLRTGVPREAKQ
jgi:hypothetical protein